jgi:hypothetical protein
MHLLIDETRGFCTWVDFSWKSSRGSHCNEQSIQHETNPLNGYVSTFQHQSDGRSWQILAHTNYAMLRCRTAWIGNGKMKQDTRKDCAHVLYM